MGQIWALASILILVLIGHVASDINQDKAKCTEQLISLATCLPYVSIAPAGTKTPMMPTADCCTGVNQVMVKSKECVCILIKDRDDPGLGLQLNVSKVLTLPMKCHSQDPNLSECPTLLHLPANSSDAKVFEDFANTLKKLNDSSNATAANANGTPSASGNGSNVSQGQRRNQFQNEMVWGLLIAMLFTSIMININA